MMSFYFEPFETRTPPAPLEHSPVREHVFHFLAIVSLTLGAWYISWRWGYSLNHKALWFAIPLVVAETVAFLGMVLFIFNLWKVEDTPRQPPLEDTSVDVFIATYNEDPELVRLTIRDAARVTRPPGVRVVVHVLDDGRRPDMRAVADEEGANYITRTTNIGFKAGNMRNAVEQTDGEFIVVCDADTRMFPTFLEHTLGYFRDPDVAWVQTPQWFFDIPEGRSLPEVLGRPLGRVGAALGRGVERILGPVKVGSDPFCNDAQFFYDVLQRRRNWANASFCCGAGSIHRREAILRAALRRFADAVDSRVAQVVGDVPDADIRRDLTDAVTREVALETEVTPFKFHVSEDIYTSIVLHSDPTRHWKSVLHPQTESKMLSPQDLQSWLIQRFKYAGGTFDIAIHDNPVFKPGLSFKQRLMYLATFWSYFGCLFNVVFLTAPIVYLLTGIAPVSAYSFEFFKHALPFMIVNEIALVVGVWGISPSSGRAMYLAFFPIAWRAFLTVLKGQKISFPTTPKERMDGRFLHLVRPQLALLALSCAALCFGVWKAVVARGPWLGVVTNAFWLTVGALALGAIVRAAVWQPDDNDSAVASSVSDGRRRSEPSTRALTPSARSLSRSPWHRA
jgi:cellulose synthase (UDP-forming)